MSLECAWNKLSNQRDAFQIVAAASGLWGLLSIKKIKNLPF
jgi:hypothetical protein